MNTEQCVAAVGKTSSTHMSRKKGRVLIALSNDFILTLYASIVIFGLLGNGVVQWVIQEKGFVKHGVTSGRRG